MSARVTHGRAGDGMNARLSALFGNAAVLACGLVTSVVVSRSLGPAGRGEFVTWQTLAAVVGSVAVAGLPQVLVLDDWSPPGRHPLRMLVFQIGLTLLPAAVLLAVAWGASDARPGMLLAVVFVAVATQFGAVGAAEAQRVGSMGREFS